MHERNEEHDKWTKNQTMKQEYFYSAELFMHILENHIQYKQTTNQLNNTLPIFN